MNKKASRGFTNIEDVIGRLVELELDPEVVENMPIEEVDLELRQAGIDPSRTIAALRAMAQKLEQSQKK